MKKNDKILITILILATASIAGTITVNDLIDKSTMEPDILYIDPNYEENYETDYEIDYTEKFDSELSSNGKFGMDRIEYP